ncbi:MAG: hypothetical protein I3273_06975 [Candidatus Moeniiplasma glomeromycotorum]|nr:hypothetical protein [Candidatus Moeniiplasma glomeromycotorum]MCE8168262.1 hypothetical protein [Candidatus Moeniiplasma glomeromycotorum]MCE8169829.1 hypothetical protein [Candidatus Moeniiplasma glomeromycotorum]
MNEVKAMKRIIKKSTTITEMIIDDNGQTFIIDRKHSVKNNSQLITDIIIEADLENWKKLDRIYRQEIAKEAEEYKKKNPLPKTEEQNK